MSNNSKQLKYDNLYLDIAKRVSEMSFAKRMQVGAVLVKDNRIISQAWNGTPKGYLNSCENEDGETLPHVLHSESNLLTHVAKSTESSEGATLYVTHSPCLQCAKLIVQCGIVRVVYVNEYRDLDGLRLLEGCCVIVDCLQE